MGLALAVDTAGRLWLLDGVPGAGPAGPWTRRRHRAAAHLL